jgi:hypothetical protein
MTKATGREYRAVILHHGKRVYASDWASMPADGCCSTSIPDGLIGDGREYETRFECRPLSSHGRTRAVELRRLNH